MAQKKFSHVSSSDQDFINRVANEHGIPHHARSYLVRYNLQSERPKHNGKEVEITRYERFQHQSYPFPPRTGVAVTIPDPEYKEDGYKIYDITSEVFGYYTDNTSNSGKALPDIKILSALVNLRKLEIEAHPNKIITIGDHLDLSDFEKLEVIHFRHVKGCVSHIPENLLGLSYFECKIRYLHFLSENHKLEQVALLNTYIPCFLICLS